MKNNNVYTTMGASNHTDEQPAYNSAVCFCWFVWVKGYKGDPAIKWL